MFPPVGGLTFSVWICIDNFADGTHPLRLLTMVRHLQGSEEHMVCLQIVIVTNIALQPVLYVCTQERRLPTGESAGNNSSNLAAVTATFESQLNTSENCVRFQSSTLARLQGNWCHLAVVLSRPGMLKSAGLAAFYLDGRAVGTQKLQYPAACVGTAAGAANPFRSYSGLRILGHTPRLTSVCTTTVAFRTMSSDRGGSLLHLCGFHARARSCLRGQLSGTTAGAAGRHGQ